MVNHNEFTLSQLINYLTNKFADEFGMPKSEIRRYILDALSYNIVVDAIREQIDFLIECNEEND